MWYTGDCKKLYTLYIYKCGSLKIYARYTATSMLNVNTEKREKVGRELCTFSFCNCGRRWRLFFLNDKWREAEKRGLFSGHKCAKITAYPSLHTSRRCITDNYMYDIKKTTEFALLFVWYRCPMSTLVFYRMIIIHFYDVKFFSEYFLLIESL